MNLIKTLFKSAKPTSVHIEGQIEKARAEHAAAIAARANVLVGLSTFTDAEHQKAEEQSEAHRRAADRALALIADLQTMHAAALETERQMQHLAVNETLRKRAEASRQANTVESAALLRDYDVHASKLGDINARLAAIDVEREAVNSDLRLNPVADAVVSYQNCHRKHPDRETPARREKVLCWVFRYPASPRDTVETSYVEVDASEDVRQATIGPNGKPIPVLPEVYDHFGSKLLITPTLEEREVEVRSSRFRAGHSEAHLSTILLPPGFAGGERHWPR